MGREVVRAVAAQNDMALAAGIDVNHVGEDVTGLAGLAPCGVLITSDFDRALDAGVDVLVDFTSPRAVVGDIETGIQKKVATVVGTTGLTSIDLDRLRGLASAAGVPVVVAPNFAVGAILMMHCAAIAARYFSNSEIIELHHDQKMDAPSGTAIKTAEMILAARQGAAPGKRDLVEKVQGVRGGELGGIHMHSVRLPGLIAHQEVIFGDLGQTLTIRHDSISRESFMPGVLLAIRRVREFQGLVYGLEHLLGLTEQE